jgi:crotonobetainyl-CoA:carnitine CoA-transferase CaiB-like acyl-CoA transferase
VTDEAHDDPLPLEGLRVIDVGTRISAPFCAGLLGDMGAEVVKIEDPRGGDFMRSIGPFAPTDDDGPGYSMWWAVEGRGRMGITLNLRDAEGQELFRRLVATADVVCENFRPGAMERWGIGPGDCDPRLVWARISVFGQDGPYSPRTGLDRMGIAYGGLLQLTGYPDRPPVRPGVSISDYLTGTFAAEAVVAALYRRDRPGGTGRGGVVDAPLYGSILRVMEWTIAAHDRLGVVREREGNRMATSAPLDNYPTADGAYVCVVGGSNVNFARLCAAMGRPELADDPQWATLAKRAERSDEINDLVAAWTSSRTAAEVEAACIAHEVPVGTAYSAADMVADPHFAARGDLVTVDDPVAGPHLQQAPYPRLDGRRPEAPVAAPALGEHNDEVWGGLVGLSPTELADLRSRGVI